MAVNISENGKTAILSVDKEAKVYTSKPTLKKLAIKGASWTILGFGLQMVIRLGGNLVLTRLLFPEAFGLMALVHAFLMGMAMFADLGIAQSIISSKQGDDPDFYNTAWTIQIIRGVFLTFIALAMVWPIGRFYDEPMLMKLLPLAGLTLLISGFNSTKIITANKHLNIGKLVQLEIYGQIIGLVFMIVMAWIHRSVWALAIGSIVGVTAKMYLSHVYIPGPPNRLCWSSKASNEILHFGKWIILSSIAGFLVGQGDRIILGKILDTRMLGIYSLAFGLGSLPQMVMRQLSHKLLLPLYAKKDAIIDLEFRKKVLKMRSGLTLAFMTGSFLLALIGPTIIRFLYDARYHGAGVILSALALAFVPKIIILSCDIASLAKADARRFSILRVSNSIVLLMLMSLGGYLYGLWGIVGAIPVTEIIIYPVIVWSVKKHGLWMPWHDLISFCIYVGFAVIFFI